MPPMLPRFKNAETLWRVGWGGGGGKVRKSTVLPIIFKEPKEAASRFGNLEKLSQNFSIWSFAIRVNLPHP